MSHAYGFEGGTDVPRALPRPNHITERHGGMIERGDAYAAVECGGEKGIAGAKTGTQNAELLVALLLKPVDATANVDDRLAAGGNGASDVSAYRIIGALELRRAANVMIRLAQAQGGNTKTVEERNRERCG